MPETAAQVGISVTAAKSRFFRAKAALRRSKELRKINVTRFDCLRADGRRLRHNSRLQPGTCFEQGGNQKRSGPIRIGLDREK
jgi:hypothetical protein